MFPQTKNLRQIGSGAFTKCYDLNKKEVLVVSECPIKECMSLGWFPNSLHFPKVERLDYKDGIGLYKMPKYKVFRSATLLEDLLCSTDRRLLGALYDLYYSMGDNSYYNAVKTLTNTKLLHHTHRTMLLDALDACANYGDDVCFEVCPSNVALSNNGRLVLLDCFYSERLLQETRFSGRFYEADDFEDNYNDY